LSLARKGGTLCVQGRLTLAPASLGVGFGAARVMRASVQFTKLLASILILRKLLPQDQWGTLPMSERGFGPNPVDAQVGYNARTMRSRLGFSQGQVAEQLGLTPAEYQECETGMRRYGPERLLKLARLMDISPDYFF
jgi:DNA-binding XRE family transcriptional regulator